MLTGEPLGLPCVAKRPLPSPKAQRGGSVSGPQPALPWPAAVRRRSPTACTTKPCRLPQRCAANVGLPNTPSSCGHVLRSHDADWHLHHAAPAGSAAAAGDGGNPAAAQHQGQVRARQRRLRRAACLRCPLTEAAWLTARHRRRGAPRLLAGSGCAVPPSRCCRACRRTGCGEPCGSWRSPARHARWRRTCSSLRVGCLRWRRTCAPSPSPTAKPPARSSRTTATQPGGPPT